MANIRRIEQAIMPGDDVVLDAPSPEMDDIAPEDPSAQGGTIHQRLLHVLEERAARGRFAALCRTVGRQNARRDNGKDRSLARRHGVHPFRKPSVTSISETVHTFPV